jgi:hypothetical protein
MKFPWKKRVRVFKPLTCLEQLEPRIMLDAAVDAACGCPQMDPFPLGFPPEWDFSALHQAPPADAENVIDAHGRFLEPASQRDLQVVAIPHSALGVKGVTEAVSPDAHILIYDNTREDLQAVRERLNELVDAYGQKIGTLVVLEHGDNALLSVGTDKIDLMNVGEKSHDLKSLGALFAEDGQIQFFGCSLAADAVGKALIDLVSTYSGKDVFASTNATGSGEGKDWALEYSSNPSAVANSVVDADAMAAIPLDLDYGDVVITKGTVGPLTQSTSTQTVNLSEAFSLYNKIAGQPMTAWIVGNPSSSEVWESISIDTAFATSLLVTSTQVNPVQIRLTDGTDGQINAVIGTLQGVLKANEQGLAQILLFAEDSDGDWASAVLDVSVVSPLIVVPTGPLTVTQNMTTPISGISLTDADVGTGNQLTVTVSAIHGTLTVQVPASLPGEEPVKYSSSVITFTDTLTNANTALAGLEYKPTDKFTGSDTITITVVDQTKPDPGQDQATIALTILNVTPTVTAPASLSVTNVGQHLVRGLTVADADIGSTNLTVTLSVSHGTLNVPTSTTVTGNNTAGISINDTLNSINTLLSGLRYTSSAGYEGADSLVISVDDRAVPTSGTATATVPIDVNAADLQPPVVTVPGAQTVTQNAATAISGISVTDADVGTDGKLTVTVSVSHGTLTIQVPASTPGQTPVSYTNSVITFTDTLSNVNTALAGLTYKSSSGYAGSDVLTITAVDQAPSPGSDSETVAINVTAPPTTPPAITVPGTQSVTQNTTMPISGISVADVDAGSTGQLTLTLSVSHGTLTVDVPSATPGGASQTFSGSVITFTNTLTSINTALAGLRYTPANGYLGSDTLTVTAVDQSTPSPGSDSETVAITVTAPPATDPDVIVPGPQTVPQNATSAMTGIYISDEGALPAEKMTVTLSVNHGTLTVQVPATPPGSTPVTYSNSVITFTDTLTNVNTALAGLKYAPTEKYYGSDTLTVTVVDEDQPQPGTDQETVAITITNVAPTVNAPAAVMVPKGSSGNLINGISISDPDIGATKLTVTLAVYNGKLNVPTSASVTGNDTSTLAITDTLANVNQMLSGLRFTPTATYVDFDVLSIKVSDLATPIPGESSRNVTILSTLAADSPIITRPAVQTVNEDTVIALNPPISVAYVDSSRELRVTLVVTNGTLLAGWKGYLSSYTGEGTAQLAMTGNLNAVNYGLNGLRYVPNHNYYGTDALSITVSTQGATPDVTAQTSLTVNSVNDPPVLTIPSTLSTRSGSPSLVPGISVTDPDVGLGNLSLDLKVLHGTLTIPGFQPSSNIVFTDTLNATQSNLSSITYTSAQGYTGPDYLTLTVSDNGNSGAGGKLSATKTLTINVS